MPLVDPRTAAFFAHFAKAYPGRTAIMVAMLVLSGLLEGVSVVTLLPLLEVATSTEDGATSGIGLMLEEALGRVGLEPTLGVLTAIIVVGITLKALALWLAMRQVGFTVARVTLDLRLRLVRALLRANWGYIGRQQVGGFANSISHEAVVSASAYREACIVLGGIFQVLAYVAISAAISWEVTLVAVITGLLLLRGLRYFVAMGRAAGEQGMRLTKSLASRLVDALQGIKPLKAMAREDRLWPLLEREAGGLDEADRRNVIAAESMRLFQEPIITLVLAVGLILLLGAAERSFASVIVLAFVFYRLMTNVKTLQVHYQAMANSESKFWSLKSQIDEAEAEAERNPGTRRIEGLDVGIELRNVSFSYGELPVLRDLSVVFPSRKLTAIVGSSGSGKSTILDLVTGLRRPTAGEVHVDGVPMREIDLASWRETIGYVPQDVFLFHDTVRQNVSLGDKTVSDEDVEEALAASGASDFIHRDAQGIDAVISPQGASLSGGQRQRLAIARALVKKPSLLILDEATTGLDPKTEAEIMATLQELRSRVTIIAVSHQPALRKAADETFELEDGRLLAARA